MPLKLELLEIIEKQKEMIDKQNKLIAELVNQNAEQENMINEFMRNIVSHGGIK